MTRDAAPRLGHHKPALIESRFFPALQASQGWVGGWGGWVGGGGESKSVGGRGGARARVWVGGVGGGGRELECAVVGQRAAPPPPHTHTHTNHPPTHTTHPTHARAQGESGKMSASNLNSAIFVTDTPKQIK